MLGSVTVPTPVGIGLHVSLTQSSDKRAQAVLPSVVQSALNGNLTAWRCLDERRNLGIATERAVWASGWAQASTQRPDLLALYNQYKSKVPAVNNTSPEAAAASVLANPYSAPGMGTPAAAASPDTPALSTTANAIIAKTGALPLWLTLVLAGGLGYFVYKLVKKG
jgi:hypothetical protein